MQKEQVMANTNNPNKKRPGEKEPGKYHYNPGNMSGKTIEILKDEFEQENNVDMSTGYVPVKSAFKSDHKV
jgi:hypothetical protein